MGTPPVGVAGFVTGWPPGLLVLGVVTGLVTWPAGFVGLVVGVVGETVTGVETGVGETVTIAGVEVSGGAVTVTGFVAAGLVTNSLRDGWSIFSSLRSSC